MAALATPGLAQTTHDHNSAHSEQSPLNTLSEPGQGAFAAISEIVSLLEKSPDTDWSKVDLDSLQAHLVDMNMLMSHTAVDTLALETGLQMRVSLSGQGGAAASRMVRAHAPVLAEETGWDSSVSNVEGEMVWTVASDESVRKIQALGFYGLMAIGDHHREHHLQIATGQNAH
ncbi:hypothetical protein GP644_21755 [Parasedimentitalea maritima]|uniref:Uncharacterized protein n=2 Tax=Parasedimentitalea maritima TaxID=2578117 RepID=A0A6A4R729_9RHOB|nr:hypothetical protein GP644_21755 [Zongyanglinia marina]